MSGERDAPSLVDELVHQFTDPFAFYRELIQNSLDAGSTRVEVSLRFNPGAKGGLCLASVADWGEGMNRRLIEDVLVTKFRSTKEHDLTKIGKFGIGFVSVFACAPDAVTVDTGRDGESWRVLFSGDTRYELLASHEPFEGTCVTVHKTMSADDYEAFVLKSKVAVSKWCRHSEADVTFTAGKADGSPPPPALPIKAPFTVDAPFQVEHREEGTHIVAGPARALPAETGFYNRGLTLKETTEPVVRGVAVKIVSRYLEHTMTRDDVRRDRNYDTAMTLVRQLVEGPLQQALPAELEKAAQRPDGAGDWGALFDFAVERLPEKALWLREQGGGAVSVKQAKAALAPGKAMVVATGPSPLVDRMKQAGLVALELEAGPRLRRVQDLLGAKVEVLADEAFTYVEPPLVRPAAFALAARELLTRCGVSVGDVGVAEVRGGAREDLCVVVDAVGRPLPMGEARRSPFAAGARALLVFNRAHLAIRAAEPLLERAPRLAALLMVRHLLLVNRRLDAAADRRLTDWSLA